MIDRLLDKGTFDIIEWKIDIDDRGRSIIRAEGIAQSQGEDVEFEIRLRPSVIHAWPKIKDIPKRGPGRPPKKINGDEE